MDRRKPTSCLLITKCQKLGITVRYLSSIYRGEHNTLIIVQKVEWADLATLDLEKFDVPGGKQELAKELYDAIQRVGKLFENAIVETKHSTETLSRLLLPHKLRPRPRANRSSIRHRQRSLRKFNTNSLSFTSYRANRSPEKDLPASEKMKYRAGLETGAYNGYKPLGLREISPGVFDNTKIFNIPKFIPSYERPKPDIVNAHRVETERFARYIHDNIVRKLLVLCAIILELPEEYFLQHHRYEEKSDCHLRYMKYHSRTAEENAKLGET